MIYAEDNRIKLGGTLLPGVVGKIDVNCAALIEEIQVEGSTVRPKQAVGYEDSKLTIELIVGDTAGETALTKIARIKALCRAAGQSVPKPVSVVCEEAAVIGLTTVLVKSVKAVYSNKTDTYAVTIELWEYIPMTITAVKSGGASAAAPALTDNYQRYLDDARGSAPRISDKTARSPADDNILMRGGR